MLCEKLDELADLLGYRPSDRKILSLVSTGRTPLIRYLAEEISEALGLEVPTYVHSGYDK